MYDEVIDGGGEDVNGRSAKLANLLGALGLLIQDVLAEADASDSAAAALICVGSHPRESIGSLSQALGISHSGTVRLVDRLVGEGLIRRTRTSEDRRASALDLSAKGARRFQAILRRREEALAAFTDELGASEVKRLTTSFSRMLAKRVESKQDARRVCRLCREDACRPSGCPVERAIGS